MNIGQIFKTYGGWHATLVYHSQRNDHNGEVYLFVHHVSFNVKEDVSKWHLLDGTTNLDGDISDYDIITSTGA